MGSLIPFPVDFPDLGIEPWSLALQADSLPTELSWKPLNLTKELKKSDVIYVTNLPL